MYIGRSDRRLCLFLFNNTVRYRIFPIRKTTASYYTTIPQNYLFSFESSPCRMEWPSIDQPSQMSRRRNLPNAVTTIAIVSILVDPFFGHDGCLMSVLGALDE
mmetsp:Transcript_3353/g.7403  ORF Transcript_3353/g.7403 Transcript_3353/m.7403 type:complete len:103 (+) Transcript_3353:1946-2254(+)